MPSYIDTVLKEKIKEILDRIYWQGVDAGGDEYSGDGWFCDDELEEIESLLKSSLEHFAQERDREWLKAMETVPLHANGFSGDVISIHDLCEQMGYTEEKIKDLLAPTKGKE